MWKFVLGIEGFPDVQQRVCARTGLLCSCLAWVIGIHLGRSVYWRVWELDSTVVPIVYIGLWEVHYYYRYEYSGTEVHVLIKGTIDEDWIFPTEMQYGREMMRLASSMQLVALILTTVALWVSRFTPYYIQFMQMYYKISVFFTLPSSGIMAGAVSWNYVMDVSGETTFDFPFHFPVNKQNVVEKHFSYVLPLGVVTAFLSFLSSILFIRTKILTKPTLAEPKYVP